MSNVVLLAVVGAIVVAGWIWCAYALGRYFGRQEQFLIDLKRETAEHRKEVLRRQQEMEEDWAAYYEQEKGQQMPPVPDTPVPSEPEYIRPIKNTNYK